MVIRLRPYMMSINGTRTPPPLRETVSVLQHRTPRKKEANEKARLRFTGERENSRVVLKLYIGGLESTLSQTRNSARVVFLVSHHNRCPAVCCISSTAHEYVRAAVVRSPNGKDVGRQLRSSTRTFFYNPLTEQHTFLPCLTCLLTYSTIIYSTVRIMLCPYGMTRYACMYDYLLCYHYSNINSGDIARSYVQGPWICTYLLYHLVPCSGLVLGPTDGPIPFGTLRPLRGAEIN